MQQRTSTLPPYPRAGIPRPPRHRLCSLRPIHLVFERSKLARAVVKTLWAAGIYVERVEGASLRACTASIEVLAPSGVASDSIFHALGYRYPDLIAVTDQARSFDVGVLSSDYDKAVLALEPLILDRRGPRRLIDEVFFEVITGPAVTSQRIAGCLAASGVETVFVSTATRSQISMQPTNSADENLDPH